MAIHRLGELTWEEARGLDRVRTVAILPVGATEAHGPHLPLCTDVLIGEAMAEAGARRLSRRGFTALLLPPLPYSTARFAAAFHGTISLRAETAAALLVDIATSLHRAGIGTLALANAHLDPDHLTALHTAVEAIRERGLMTIIFPDLTRRPWGSRLTEEFKSGACHAGRFEGSVVLARAPELVREEIRRALEENPVSLSSAIREGKSDFREAGGPRAYFGDPAAATAEEGEETIETLASILEDAVLEALEPGGVGPAAALGAGRERPDGGTSR